LSFNLIWPSGITLGEATLTASRAGKQIHLEASVVADIPQYHVGYTFASDADENLCSIRFSETLREGRSTRETTFDFDQAKHVVRRTRGGRTTESPIPDCARDPVALLYHFRRQLAAGLLKVGTPEATGEFYLGDNYTVHYDAIAAESVKVGSKTPGGDRFLIRVQDHGEERSFEVWIRTDASRAPVAVRVPLSLGTLAAELE
jgi:uncharacterized protein DUF3108